jgi:hypothetical protein
MSIFLNQIFNSIMPNKSNPKIRFIVMAIGLACIIHIVFISQMLVAVQDKGLILPKYFGVFFPHVMLMYCLPPEMPFSDKGVNYWGVAGKIIDAVPASLLYGAVIALVFVALKQIRKKSA